MSGEAATAEQIDAWCEGLEKQPKCLTVLTKKRGLSRETIRKARVGWDGERFTIPVRDEAGRIVNVRRYRPGAPDKVLSIKGYGSVRLYAPTPAPSDDAPVLMVEGEADCLKAAQECPGWWVVSGTGGASNPPSVEALERLRGRHVVIAYDCDDAGRAGARKAAERLASVAALIAVAELSLGDGEDVTDWFVTHGKTADALDRLAREALSEREAARRPADDLVAAAQVKADEASRNDAGFWLACQLRDERYSRAEAAKAMTRYARLVKGSKADPYTKREALDSLAQAYSKSPREPSGVATVHVERFRLIGPAQLGQPVRPVEFLIGGLWPVGSFGPIGGPKKSLKTYCAYIASLALAAGVPAFGAWPVPRPRPVIYYGGEGGQAMHMRRLQRIAADVYGLDLRDVPFYLVTDVGPFDSKEFRESLRRNVAEVGPGLVVLDSLYNYHPAGIEVGNLYERGRVLSDLSHTLSDASEDTALWVVDHFNKNGPKGLDLDRLAQAGMAQWADSWVLLDHRTTPDVPGGQFSLRADVGSRQWGGASWTIDLNIGPYDMETHSYLSPMKVSAEPLDAQDSRAGTGRRLTRDDLQALILAAVEEQPGRTKARYVSDLTAEHNVGKPKVDDAWGALAEEAALLMERKQVTEGGRKVSRDVWSVGSRRVTISGSRGKREPSCQTKLPDPSEDFPFNLSSPTEDDA